MPKDKSRIGIICTRLGGLDGVSLEVDKWVRVFKKEGHKIYLCAGEKGRESFRAATVPALSVNDEENKNIINNFFDDGIASKFLKGKIENEALRIEKEISLWLKKNKIKKIIVENINSLPIHVPAAVAIDRILEENLEVSALFHHHDFHWERKSYFGGCGKIKPYLKKYFPPKRKNAVHVVINSIAKEALFKKYGIYSIVVPNIFDRFTAEKDEYNATLRKDFGIEKDDTFFVSPVRIVPRKNLEAAITLVKKLRDPKIKLIVAGCVDPYDFHSRVYFEKIQKLSRGQEDRIKFICGRVAPRRQKMGNYKVYSLADVYARADFMLYPTLYEGWGNAFGEAMAFGVPTMVNRYKVFRRDIEKFGFSAVEINNGKVNGKTAKEVIKILSDNHLKNGMIKHNREVIKKYFGPELLIKKLKPFLK